MDNYGGEDLISNELIHLNLELNDKEEVLAYLANDLTEKGYVTDEFQTAILEREEEYPTGIPAKVNIAIPHVDSKYVNQTKIAVATLVTPVKFSAMDNPQNEIDVHIVFMLAISDPHGHLTMLQKLMGLISNEAALKELLETNDKETVYEILKKNLED